MDYKFAVGQTVEYKPIGGSVGLFTVVRQMPQEDGAIDRKYRIKNTREGYERSVLECDLTATENPESMYAVAGPLRRGGHG
jgi:hypothetical protein